MPVNIKAKVLSFIYSLRLLAAVLTRGHTGVFLEEPHKVLRIEEAQRGSHFLDGEFRRGELTLGVTEQTDSDIFLSCLSGLGLDHIPEIVRREEHLVGEVLDCRKALGLGLTGGDIFINQFLEFGDRAEVQILPCDKLPFVEAEAIVQNQFYIRYKNLPWRNAFTT